MGHSLIIGIIEYIERDTEIFREEEACERRDTDIASDDDDRDGFINTYSIFSNILNFT